MRFAVGLVNIQKYLETFDLFERSTGKLMVLKW